MMNRSTATRSKRELFAHAIVLIHHPGDVVRFDERTDWRTSHGQPTDPSSRGHVAIEQGRRYGKRIRDVIEAVLIGIVGRKKRPTINLERERVPDGVGVFG